MNIPVQVLVVVQLFWPEQLASQCVASNDTSKTTNVVNIFYCLAVWTGRQ